MAIINQNKLFGTVLRTRALMAISQLGETFPTELSRVINARQFPVQRLLDSLEKEGLIVTRKLGVERRVTLNPHYIAYSDLSRLLTNLAEKDQELQKTLADRRTRPRRRTKAI